MKFDNSSARLPERFFARVLPARAPDPVMIKVNLKLGEELGLETSWLTGSEGVAILSGRSVAPGSDPIATAYAGHQFGGFSPQLGDGRAILLGEVIGRDGKRRDIQLKGGGRTPYSRNGDGRAALGPVLREYIVSEAMAALGVPTTRSLAAVATGERIYREGVLPGAVLTRVASSHIRVGTFQFFAARGDVEGLHILADHVIARHYPEAALSPRPYRALLDKIIEGQASLIAHWMQIGFIHGVMNTDNVSIACETIDYGPCAFMDAYHPETVFSSIDRNGRYAYGNQPRIGLWNLTRFAETLIPLLHADEEQATADAQEALSAYGPRLLEIQLEGFHRKLGLEVSGEEDADFVSAMFASLAANQVDFTLFFRRLGDAIEPGTGDDGLRVLFADPTAADEFLVGWRARLEREQGPPSERRRAMHAVNPTYIPRNHRVEEVIRAAVDEGDFAPFERLMDVLAHPFEDKKGSEYYLMPPRHEERVLATFCGT